MLQFARGKFTKAHAKHMLNGSFDLVWATIREKFVTDGEFYWNERLEYEKQRRAKFTESRRKNAIKGDKPSKEDQEDMPNHMHDHMGNVIIIENIGKGVQGKNQISYPSLDDVTAYFKEKGYKTETAKIAFEYYNASNWHDRDGKPVKNWKQKMISVWFKEEHKEPVKVNDRFQTPILR
jgi:hypothetical protein